MTISRIGQEVLTRNMQQVGGQTLGVRRRELKADKPADEVSTEHDQVDLSQQAREGQKAGETTGIAGREGNAQTGKKSKTSDGKKAQAKEQVEELRKNVDEAKRDIKAGKPETPHEEAAAAQEAPGHQPPHGGGQTPPGAGHPGGPSSNTSADTAHKQKEIEDDYQRAQTIYLQMAMDRQKWMAQMWKLMQDTQNEIMNIMQDVALRKAASMDKISRKWAACLGEYKFEG